MSPLTSTAASIAAACLLAAALPACTSQELYQTGQGWQRQECQKLLDRDERARCEKSTALSYEKYRAEVEAAKRPAP